MNKRKINPGNVFTRNTTKDKLNKGIKTKLLNKDKEPSEVNIENSFDGEEDGVERSEDGVLITPFNVQEELQDGHFDKHGHFIWNKSSMRDNWIDSIDWHQIKNRKVSTHRTDSLMTEDFKFNEIDNYKELLQYMQPGETITKTLKRLGNKGRKLSSIERLKLKKLGNVVDNNAVTKVTELANNIWNYTGHMDIYQETFEKISERISKLENNAAIKQKQEMLDLFSNDFNEQEKELKLILQK